jgi:MinD-like ATPase involved in chromosome partitioning or flagellar assembly
VLAIDFDLEAPGIGTMLLNRQELPKFGTLDYLVENGLSGIDEAFIADLNGDSILGSAGGRVTVIPAIGQATINNPADALSKISRAYLEDIGEDGYIASLSDQLLEMVSLFEKTGAYDIVLVDVRAGLHETTAAAILGLGAEVLLFGSDQPQTFLGYNLLLAHLARFPIQAEDDWRDRLRFVHAKASDSARKRASADERFLQLYDLIVQTPPDSGSTEPLNADDFDLVWEDELVDLSLIDPFEAPSIIHILDDMRYRDFDPVSDDTLLDSASYGGTFKELLEYADMMIDYSEPSQL